MAKHMKGMTLTVDLKVGCIAIGLMAGWYPRIWCTWDSRLGLNGTQITPRSSLLHTTILYKLTTNYNGDAKEYEIICMGVEYLPSIGNSRVTFDVRSRTKVIWYHSDNNFWRRNTPAVKSSKNGAAIMEMQCVNCRRCAMKWLFLLQTPPSSPSNDWELPCPSKVHVFAATL